MDTLDVLIGNENMVSPPLEVIIKLGELVYKEWDDSEVCRYYPGGEAEHYNVHSQPHDTWWERHCEVPGCYVTGLLYERSGEPVHRSMANRTFHGRGWRWSTARKEPCTCPAHAGFKDFERI